MNPYEVLGVAHNATLTEIKKRYRALSAMHHPDKETGDRQKFEEVKQAYDVLSDFGRRERYDKLGRTDESPVTPQRIRIFIEQTMRTVIEAQRPNGSTDDPVWHNIKDRVLLSIRSSRIPLATQRYELQRKLERTQRLIERFRPRSSFDPVGDSLRQEKARYEAELRLNDDATELSQEAEAVLNTYDYDVGPGPEGHFSPGPTSRPGGRIPIR